jgi:hypothetical protein
MTKIKVFFSGLFPKSKKGNLHELDKTKSTPAITEEERLQFLRTKLPVKDDLRKSLLEKRYFVRF